MQLQEITQDAVFRLKWHNFKLGIIRALPYKDVTLRGSHSKIWPTSYRTELDVSLYQHENRISLKYHQQETFSFQVNVTKNAYHYYVSDPKSYL